MEGDALGDADALTDSLSDSLGVQQHSGWTAILPPRVRISPCQSMIAMNHMHSVVSMQSAQSFSTLSMTLNVAVFFCKPVL